MITSHLMIVVIFITAIHNYLISPQMNLFKNKQSSPSLSPQSPPSRSIWRPNDKEIKKLQQVVPAKFIKYHSKSPQFNSEMFMDFMEYKQGQIPEHQVKEQQNLQGFIKQYNLNRNQIYQNDLINEDDYQTIQIKRQIDLVEQQVTTILDDNQQSKIQMKMKMVYDQQHQRPNQQKLFENLLIHLDQLTYTDVQSPDFLKINQKLKQLLENQEYLQIVGQNLDTKQYVNKLDVDYSVEFEFNNPNNNQKDILKYFILEDSFQKCQIEQLERFDLKGQNNEQYELRIEKESNLAQNEQKDNKVSVMEIIKNRKNIGQISIAKKYRYMLNDGNEYQLTQTIKLDNRSDYFDQFRLVITNLMNLGVLLNQKVEGLTNHKLRKRIITIFEDYSEYLDIAQFYNVEVVQTGRDVQQIHNILKITENANKISRLIDYQR